jgi:hypothetical protein
MEVDFLIAKHSITSRHNITPIEVKSSQRYTFTSLKKMMAKYKEYLSQPIIVHTADLQEKDGYLFLPLYMVPLL